ncbi:Hsp20 family protein [Parvibaculum sp.]|uniref:Hsp20 family protein n=1 Tax=Parvibaculum sp. TaxID=2024848 RepID=UPI00272FBD7F|nr:Hsp20 family protein [Parvibaculum sp.]MDP1626274.1 Hsp20 family protein [Parvibaculum sp.]MDP2151592.1 Hsp20 family protein [Parvibaculum sp.]MDP3328997.1 Hsp20 family protein [Parvibaculum sp.]
MTRVMQFNSPFLLGFDEMERLLERVAKASDGYPPYNVEQVSAETGERLRITLAVAGFSRDELSVTVEENQLVIRGRQREETDRTYLHRGIAARQFQRSFVLADGIVVRGATLENGLLMIDLEKPEPKRTTRTIDISEAAPEPLSRSAD